MSDGCTVTFDGTGGGTYIIPCNMAEYIGSDLVNHNSSNFYGYSHVSSGSREYPYISFGSNSYPVYYESYQSQHYITNASNVTFNSESYYYRDINFVWLLMAFLICVRCITGIFRS